VRDRNARNGAVIGCGGVPDCARGVSQRLLGGLGTAAPVIALAAVVAESQVIRPLFAEGMRVDEDTPPSLALKLILGSFRSLSFCVILQSACFIDALTSLSAEQDEAGTWRGMLKTIRRYQPAGGAATVLIAAAGFLNSSAGRALAEAQESARAEHAEDETDDSDDASDS
jgi:hypothetical protein